MSRILRAVPARKKPTPSPRKRVRRTREQAEAQILAAAEEFLEEHDFRELTVEALTQRVGMGRSAFYNYFADRGAVIAALLAGIEGEYLTAYGPWIEGREGPEGELSSVLLAGAETYARHGRALRALHQASFHDETIHRAYNDALERLVDAAVPALRRENREGRAQVREPRKVMRALVVMNATMQAERLTVPNPESPRALARTLAFIWERTIYGSAGD